MPGLYLGNYLHIWSKANADRLVMENWGILRAFSCLPFPSLKSRKVKGASRRPKPESSGAGKKSRAQRDVFVVQVLLESPGMNLRRRRRMEMREAPAPAQSKAQANGQPAMAKEKAERAGSYVVEKTSQPTARDRLGSAGSSVGSSKQPERTAIRRVAGSDLDGVGKKEYKNLIYIDRSGWVDGDGRGTRTMVSRSTSCTDMNKPPDLSAEIMADTTSDQRKVENLDKDVTYKDRFVKIREVDRGMHAMVNSPRNHTNMLYGRSKLMADLRSVQNGVDYRQKEKAPYNRIVSKEDINKVGSNVMIVTDVGCQTYYVGREMPFSSIPDEYKPTFETHF